MRINKINCWKLAVLIILFSCNHEAEIPSDEKRWFLQKEIIESSSSSVPWVVEYKYENDRLVKIGSDTVLYDNENKIISIGNFNRYEYNSIGQLIYRWSYALWSYRYFFTYNQFDQVVKVKVMIDKGPEYSPSKLEFKYSFEYENESDLNPISGWNGVTYTYDDKKRPLEGINPLLFGENPAVNNVLNTTNANDTTSTVYTYNSGDYPIKAVTTTAVGTTITVSYEYDYR